LAGDNPALVVGGFLGDFVKGPLKGEYPEHIEKGIALHRRIDSWSDQHHAVKQIRLLLPDQFGRYSAIIADMLCDHVLASEWDHFAEVSLQQFCNHRIGILESNNKLFSSRARQVLQRIKTDNWLTRYVNLGYSLGALSGIGRRLSRENPLHLLEQPVSENYQQLQKLCRQALNDTATNVAEWRVENEF
jgi:acyl carrier protein phosphodiesterase